jgi:transposase
VAKEIDPQRLMFVDEMGANIALHSLYAWSERGQRTRCSVSRNRGKNTTLLASISFEGMGSSLVVTGTVDATLFEAYLERVLLPHLRPGRILMMDNLCTHKGERVRKSIEGMGCELVHLPFYSPDFNHIEEAFSKIKSILRKVGAKPVRPWWRRSVERSRRSVLEMRGVSEASNLAPPTAPPAKGRRPSARPPRRCSRACWRRRFGELARKIVQAAPSGPKRRSRKT